MPNKTIVFIVSAILAVCASQLVEAGDGLLVKENWKLMELPVKFVPADALSIPEIKSVKKGSEIDFAAIERGGLKLSLITYPNGGVPRMPTTAFVCFDDANLYLMMTARQSNKYKLRANKQEKESAHIWYDDNFELFVDPFLSRSEYAHFIVNPLGEMYDAWCLIKMVPDPKGVDQSELIPQLFSDLSYSSGTKVNTRSEPGKWSALFTVPFSSLGLRSAPLGQPWGFNFCHSNRENKELSEWKLTRGGLGFHTPSKYGALIFGRKTPPVSAKFAMKVAGYGDNVIILRTTAPKAIEAVVSVSSSLGKKRVSKRVALRKGENVDKVSFKIPWKASGKCKIAADLKVGDELAGFFIQNINLKAPFELSLPLREIYSSDKEIAGSIKFALGGSSMAKAKLKISLGGKSAEIAKLKGNLLEFGISPKGLQPGNHVLKLDLIVDGETVRESTVEIHVLDSPFGF